MTDRPEQPVIPKIEKLHRHRLMHNESDDS
jgi:hypothetical protein